MDGGGWKGGKGGWCGRGRKERREKKWGQIGNWAVDAKDGLTGRERENVVALGARLAVQEQCDVCRAGSAVDVGAGRLRRRGGE